MRGVLERILLELQQVRFRLDDIERNQAQQMVPQAIPASEFESFLGALPDHLRKSYLTVRSLGECDAAQVSRKTGRARALESGYLNELIRLGWLHKHRESRTAMFRIVNRRPALAPDQV